MGFLCGLSEKESDGRGKIERKKHSGRQVSAPVLSDALVCTYVIAYALYANVAHVRHERLHGNVIIGESHLGENNPSRRERERDRERERSRSESETKGIGFSFLTYQCGKVFVGLVCKFHLAEAGAGGADLAATGSVLPFSCFFFANSEFGPTFATTGSSGVGITSFVFGKYRIGTNGNRS